MRLVDALRYHPHMLTFRSCDCSNNAAVEGQFNQPSELRFITHSTFAVVMCCVPDMIELTCDAVICASAGAYHGMLHSSTIQLLEVLTRIILCACSHEGRGAEVS